MDVIITIDIETAAVKIVAYDVNKKLIAIKKGTYPTFHSKAIYSEQDPEQVYITVLFVLKSLLNEANFLKKHTVVSIVFSASMHSVLAVDKNGVPNGNAIIWSDNRATVEANTLKNSALGRQIYEATGTPIHPMSPLAKIAWIKNNDQERFEKTSKFISLKEYVIFQLTGQYFVDYSLASATGLFNIHTKKWEKKSLAFAGITEAHLSEPASILDATLILRPEIAKNLRLSPSTKLILGSTDGCLATLGSGILGPGQAVISINSSGAVRLSGAKIVHDEKQRFFNYILEDEIFISGGPTNNGGLAFEWFVKQFNNFDTEADFEEKLENCISDISKIAAGANGLLFLPYLLGERAPLWNANARGVYFGININHDLGHFAKATMEGILFEIYSIGKLLLQYRSIENVNISGTYGIIPNWAQTIADIFGLQVNATESANSANDGALLLALTQMGVYSSLVEASKSTNILKVYLPNLDNHHRYQKMFVIFEKLCQKLEDEFDLIAELQEV